jgi:hypothetical protein
MRQQKSAARKTQAKRPKATRKHVQVGKWESLSAAQRADTIPYVPDATKASRDAPVTVGATGCACLPPGGAPGVWVWDGFNPRFLPRPDGVGKWRLIYDSALGWTWEAVN